MLQNKNKSEQAASQLITRIFKAALLPLCCISDIEKAFLMTKLWASWAPLLCLGRYISSPGTLAGIHRVQNKERSLSTERIPSIMAKSLILTSMLLLPCCLEMANKQYTGYNSIQGALNCAPMWLFHHFISYLKFSLLLVIHYCCLFRTLSLGACTWCALH